MTENRYAMKASIIVGSSVMLMLFFFILVAHHQDIPDQARKHRDALLGSRATADERIKPVGRLDVAAVEAPREAAKTAVAAVQPARDGQQIYQATCVVCHGTGIAGAPKMEDKGQWAKRIAKGPDALYASALNGVQSPAGVMPAKGGNPGLKDAEVKAAVDYMVARSK